MSIWAWILVGMASLFVVSLLVGLAVAATLRTIGRRISELYESEDWAQLPPTRALHESEAEPEAAKPSAKKGRVIRLR
jgi:hypothetical protein